MPLFQTTARIPSEAVVAAWKRLFPKGPKLVAAGNETDRHYKVGGKRDVLVAQIDAPIPGPETLEAIRSSWMWQQPDDLVRTHASHALVTAIEKTDALEAAWDVARVCAALLSAGTGAALYWGNSRQMHPVELVQELAAEDTFPVPLCVGITISAASRQGPFSAATHGLETFGHKEFEVRDTSMGIGELRMTLLDLAGYVLKQGPVLKHGQTFGPRADTRWSIRHEPSQLVDGRDAIVLGIP